MQVKAVVVEEWRVAGSGIGRRVGGDQFGKVWRRGRGERKAVVVGKGGWDRKGCSSNDAATRKRSVHRSSVKKR